jgi:hypothetical protein
VRDEKIHGQIFTVDVFIHFVPNCLWHDVTVEVEVILQQMSTLNKTEVLMAKTCAQSAASIPNGHKQVPNTATMTLSCRQSERKCLHNAYVTSKMAKNHELNLKSVQCEGDASRKNQHMSKHKFISQIDEDTMKLPQVHNNIQRDEISFAWAT